MKITTTATASFTAALALCLLTAAPSHAALIAHYEFDGDLTDSVGSRDGSLLNAESGLGTTGAKVGSGFLSVDTTGDADTENVGFMSGGVDFNLGTDSRTIAFFFRTTGLQTSDKPTFFSLGSGVGSDTGQRFDGGFSDVTATILRNEVNGNGGGGGDLTGFSADLDDGEWHHIAMRTVNTPSLNDVEFFIDGVSVGFGGAGSDPALNTAASALVIGDSFASSGSNPERGFIGDFDDFRIYTSALTDQDISGLAAIPEPSSLALGLLSLGGLLLARRRR